jgi:hypothetical protein
MFYSPNVQDGNSALLKKHLFNVKLYECIKRSLNKPRFSEKDSGFHKLYFPAGISKSSSPTSFKFSLQVIFC